MTSFYNINHAVRCWTSAEMKLRENRDPQEEDDLNEEATTLRLMVIAAVQPKRREAWRKTVKAGATALKVAERSRE